MREAVRSLSRLGESRAEIAELADIPTARVRECLAPPGTPARTELDRPIHAVIYRVQAEGYATVWRI